MEELFKYHKSGYLVSNLGRIKGKSVEYLKLTEINGYLMVKIGLVHRIVYETFVGEIPEHYDINHIDHNKKNNCISNLEALTKSDNQKHRHSISTNNIKGENNPNSYLLEEDILEIYTLFKNGISNYEIGEKYNIHPNYVSCIRSGKKWKHLFDKYMKQIIPSIGCNSLPLESLLKIIDDIVKTNKSNKEISDQYFLDKSIISKVRNKRIWHRAWKMYYIGNVL